MTDKSLSRRELLWGAGACAGLLLGGGLWPRPAGAGGTVVDRQPWARLEQLADGIWAVVSTPLESDDWTTGCNGGLIAGDERVLAIESFVQPAGAAWLASQALELTGRRPTDVVITHFHGDHANGLAGYAGEPDPQVWTTRTTLDLIQADDAQKQTPPEDSRARLLASVTELDPTGPTAMDLGGRSVTLHPRHGHTPSDVSIEVAEPSIVFCGDLVWSGLFPNYRDTQASAFSQSIRDLRRQRDTVYVSGHGGLTDGAGVDTLLTLVDSIESAARRGHEQGVALADAAAAFQMPAATADWVLFNPKYFEVAFKAWYQELG